MTAVAIQTMPMGSARWFSGLLVLLLAAALLWSGLRYVGNEDRFPVSRVDVAGDLQYANREEIQQLIADFAGTGFYRLDIDAMRAALTALPWIETASIRRQWPERIVVDVSERRPIARWGEAGLLAADARVFRPHQLSSQTERRPAWRQHFAHLPQLIGSQGRHSALLARWHVFQARLATVGAEIVTLVEDERRSVELQLAGEASRSNVIVRLGREDLAARVARLARIYPEYIAGDARVHSIDLRYTNGFSIGRQDGGEVSREAPVMQPAGAE